MPSDDFAAAPQTTGDLEFPDWSGGRRDRPKVGWEVMHRLSEELMHRPGRKPPPRPEVSQHPEFVL